MVTAPLVLSQAPLSRVAICAAGMLRRVKEPPDLPEGASVAWYLGEDEEAAAAAVRSGLVTILFTDMESSTASDPAPRGCRRPGAAACP